MTRSNPTPQTTRPQPTVSLRPKGSSQEPGDEEIRQRAFAIYQRRGDGPGNPQEDWDQARRELTAEWQARTATGRGAPMANATGARTANANTTKANAATATTPANR